MSEPEKRCTETGSGLPRGRRPGREEGVRAQSVPGFLGGEGPRWGWVEAAPRGACSECHQVVHCAVLSFACYGFHRKNKQTNKPNKNSEAKEGGSQAALQPCRPLHPRASSGREPRGPSPLSAVAPLLLPLASWCCTTSWPGGWPPCSAPRGCSCSTTRPCPGKPPARRPASARGRRWEPVGAGGARSPSTPRPARISRLRLSPRRGWLAACVHTVPSFLSSSLPFSLRAFALLTWVPLLRAALQQVPCAAHDAPDPPVGSRVPLPAKSQCGGGGALPNHGTRCPCKAGGPSCWGTAPASVRGSAGQGRRGTQDTLTTQLVPGAPLSYPSCASFPCTGPWGSAPRWVSFPLSAASQQGTAVRPHSAAPQVPPHTRQTEARRAWHSLLVHRRELRLALPRAESAADLRLRTPSAFILASRLPGGRGGGEAGTFQNPLVLLLQV